MSMSKKRYALVIVDDFSKYTWVLFLHSEDKAAKTIIDRIKKIKKEANLHVSMIRTNNGIEFYNSVPNDFCITKGITR